MEQLAYGLAGLGIGLGILLVFVLRQRAGASTLESLRTENRLLSEEVEKARALEGDLREELKSSDIERTKTATLNEELRARLEGQVEEQKEAAGQMQERFENLANKILDQKSAKFTEANKVNLKNVLAPLDKDIRNFRKKVEDLHEKESNQHAA
ncbi:MAG TPA: DNA recombination protein RmuC, partial [Opitutae bacterium]|nr:DNA recombination protein RmuC [Opitutae bacterium]